MTDQTPDNTPPEPLTKVRAMAIIRVGVIESDPDDPEHGNVVIDHQIDPAIANPPPTGDKLRQEWLLYNSVCDWAYQRMAVMTQKHGTLMRLNGIVK